LEEERLKKLSVSGEIPQVEVSLCQEKTMKRSCLVLGFLILSLSLYAIGTPETPEPKPEPQFVELPRTSFAFLPPGYNPRVVNSAGPMLLGQWGDVKFEQSAQGLTWEVDTSLRYSGPTRERKLGAAFLLWQEFYLLRPKDWQGGKEFFVEILQSEITKSAPGLLFSQAVNRAISQMGVRSGVLLLQGTERVEEAFVFTFSLKE
jgi:hypothetical protein